MRVRDLREHINCVSKACPTLLPSFYLPVCPHDIHVHTYFHKYTRTRTQTWTCIHIQTCVHPRTRTRTRTRIHTHAHGYPTHAQAHSRTGGNAQVEGVHIPLQSKDLLLERAEAKAAERVAKANEADRVKTNEISPVLVVNAVFGVNKY